MSETLTLLNNPLQNVCKTTLENCKNGDHSKQAYYQNLKKGSCEDLMEEKRAIEDSSKRTFNRSFNNGYFENIHLNPIKFFFSNQQDLPYTENVFLRNYWDKEETKIKEGKPDYCKWKYEPILYYLRLNHIFANQVPRANLSFHVLLKVTFFRNNIWNNFTLILLRENLEMAIAAVNYIRQH